MGNRCVITTEEREIGVYLHWNGGYDSVRCFLRYCELRGFRSPNNDCYGWARLCQVISNFFGADGLSIGVMPYSTDDRMDPGDNGVFIIKGWRVIYNICDGFKTSYDELEAGLGSKSYDMDNFLKVLDERQPSDQQLGDFLKAKKIPISEVKKGQIIYNQDYRRRWIGKPCLGFGVDEQVSYKNVLGIPYADFCRHMEEYDSLIFGHHKAEGIDVVKGNLCSYVDVDDEGMCWALPMQEDE